MNWIRLNEKKKKRKRTRRWKPIVLIELGFISGGFKERDIELVHTWRIIKFRNRRLGGSEREENTVRRF